MAARKRVKKQTLAEFRAWLSGVEELQPEDWAPTPDQWKLIRDKIGGIVEPKQPAPQAVANNRVPQNGNPYQQMTPAQAHIPLPPPPPVGGVPTGEITRPTPEASAVMPTQPPVDLSSAPAPNMDTSNGNYESGFS